MSESEKINNPCQGPVRVLIAPLDWGLGHTTRCLPIIRSFLELGADVTVAGNAKQAHLLCNEIPSLKWLSIGGYNITYSGSSLTTRLKLLLQIPKILIAIRRENRWLDKIAAPYKFDIIISDSRYGFRHKSIYSVFITHQLGIRVPFNKWLEKKLQQWNYRFINSFNECWIPDYKNGESLAGELSHPQMLPAVPAKYIGVLSRFGRNSFDAPDEEFLLFIISGPEPQRTIFEDIIERQLRHYDGKAIVIRGVVPEKLSKQPFGKISFISHLQSVGLNELMQQASFVICRSGYSSIMDIIKLRKKSILIPTPGQSEQEYLASYLMKKKLCVAVDQKSFSLKHDLDVARHFEYADMNMFQQSDLVPEAKELLFRIVGKTPSSS